MRSHLWILYHLISLLDVCIGQPPINTRYMSASLGGQQVLPCKVEEPPHSEDLEFVVTWKKGNLGIHQVLLTKVDGYTPTIQQEEYKSRLEIENKASLKISHIEPNDEDWYQCSITFTNGRKDIPSNNSWIFLTVNAPPQITRSSGTLINMPRGESVKLFCEGRGSPDPNVTWTKDGHPLNNSIRTTVVNNEVRIVNLQREDGGIYTCTFTNIVGDRSQPIKLVIEGGPYIMTQPGNQTVMEGQRVAFPCGTEGYPNIITFTWFKDNVDIRTTDSYRAGRVIILQDGSLVITTTIKTDRGWYMCRASNGLGHDEASAYLNVFYKPVVLPLPSQLTWAKGYHQQIDCPVDSNPPNGTKVVWYKDQDKIPDTGRYNVLANGTLWVSDVRESDAGSYRCAPTNTLGPGLSSNRVQVTVKDPPLFTVRPQPLYVRNVGENVTMNCSATGTPAVSIQWIKVGGKLENSDRVEVTDKYLRIKNLSKEDNGPYECRATNTILPVVAVTQLRIDNTTPHAPFNITIEPGLFHVKISWKPDHDGGTPQFYVVWFRQVSTFTWDTMTVPGQAVTSFELYGLQPDTEYEFKILSRNSFGNGSFSEVVKHRTLGYSPDAVDHLPFNKDGSVYYPEIAEPLGPTPAAPLHVNAQVKDRDILVTWRPPPTSSVPIFWYKIEYKHGDTWQQYDHKIIGNRTNNYTLPDMPTGLYDIRLRSYGVLNYSPWSNSAIARVSDDVVIPQALIGGIIGGVLFLLVAILLALVAVFYSRRKERKAKEKKFDDVNYGKPDEMNGRHHEYSPKWDRWQHNGRGDFMTSLNNSDSIFFLPQSSFLNQPAQLIRPHLLLEQQNKSGQGLVGEHGLDNERQVPWTIESNLVSDRSLPKLDQSGRLGTVPLASNLAHQARFEQHISPKLLYSHENYILPSPQSHLQQQLHHSVKSSDSYQLSPASFSYQHSPASCSPRSPVTLKTDRLSPQDIHYPGQSSQWQSPSYTYSKQSVVQSLGSKSTFVPSDVTIRPKQNKYHQDEYPSFQSEDDDVFRTVSYPRQNQVHGFPRQSSMKPGQKTYLTGDDVPEVLQGLEDISSVLAPPSEQPTASQAAAAHSRPLHPSSENMFSYDNRHKENTRPVMVVEPQYGLVASPGPSRRGINRTQDSGHNIIQRDLVDQPDWYDCSELVEDLYNSGSINPALQTPNLHRSTASYVQLPHSSISKPEFNSQSQRTADSSNQLESRAPPFHSIDYDYEMDFPRPHAHSEGSRRTSFPPYNAGESNNINSQNSLFSARLPSSSMSYPNMSLPKHEKSTLGSEPADQLVLGRDTRHNFVPSSLNVGIVNDQYPLNSLSYVQSHPQPRATMSSHPENVWSPVPMVRPLSSRGVRHSPRYSNPKTNSPGYLEDANSRYGRDVAPTDSVSHSSGIGSSRNTSQSTNSYHPHLPAPSPPEKGSASFSSGQDHDLSLDASLAHRLPLHRRDMSADENYEFDSLNALEKDIMDDLRRYSRLSSGSRTGNITLDNVMPEAPDDDDDQPGPYLDSQERFEKLREEFQQYRQQLYHSTDGIFQLPPTAMAALPIGANGEPLYPMDSDML